jgi:outer membrane receptor protein involved in Fe transport
METARTLRPIFTHCIRILLAAIMCSGVAEASQVRGRVLDESGAAIAGARVELQSAGTVRQSVTDNGGFFSIFLPDSSGTIRVSAQGFSTSLLKFQDLRGELTIKLRPAPVAQTVVVTGERNRSRMDETAANIVLLTATEVSSRAAPTLDDALRQVPGFTLFRRSNSLTANPTTQGASARGVGASGASRVLVLEDGVPLNDPFGGWVFWDRVPRVAVARAEVLRGGESLYGSGALGGVVDLAMDRHDNRATVEAAGDSLSGRDFQGVVGRQFGGWIVSGDGESFANEGTFTVAASDRGRVDAPASLSFGNGHARMEHRVGNSETAFIAGGLFAEQRNNGTVLQVNSVHLGSLSSGIDAAGAHNAFSVRLYGSGEHYHQSFSSIASNRNSELLTRWQTAPSDQLGFSAQWMRSWSAWQITGGADGRFIHGETDETAFIANSPVNLSASGGMDHLLAGFLEMATTIKRVRASMGARVDRWSNTDGFNRLTTLSNGATTLKSLSPHTETAYSPRAGAVYSASERWQITAAAYAAFRAPTLNELYRSFRQGNVLTLANEALKAEHLRGGEAGIRYLRRRMIVSGTFFRDNVDNPAGNITLTVTPNLITRQRQNIGAMRIAGSDVDFLILLPRIQLRAGYEYVSSVVSSFSANPGLVGKAVPQVPAHSGSFSAIIAVPRHWTIAALARVASRQFDDDLNTFVLGRYSTVGLSVARQTGSVTWFANVSNLLDARIQTAATPVPTYASPRIISGGMRFIAGRPN